MEAFKEIFDRLCTNLKIVATLQTSEKITTSGNHLSVDQNKLLQPMFRWFNGDNRERSIHVIDNDIKTICVISMLMRNSKILTGLKLSAEDIDALYTDECEKDYLQNLRHLYTIHHLLRNVIRGLDSFKKTYDRDGSMEFNISKCRDVINDEITKIAELFMNMGIEKVLLVD